jgi:hypothetical protein
VPAKSGLSALPASSTEQGKQKKAVANDACKQGVESEESKHGHEKHGAKGSVDKQASHKD